MKSRTRLLSVLAVVAALSLAAAHVGAIGVDASQHSQLHLLEELVVLFVIVAGIHLLALSEQNGLRLTVAARSLCGWKMHSVISIRRPRLSA